MTVDERIGGGGMGVAIAYLPFPDRPGTPHPAGRPMDGISSP